MEPREGRRPIRPRAPAVAPAAALACVAAVFLLPSAASAKDLRKRFGIGFNNSFASVAALSLKIGLPTPKPTLNVQAQVLAGFSIRQNDDDRFFLGGRLILPVVAEDNLNVYGAVGAGWARFDDDSDALRAQGVLGVEFFPFGLENLGFSAEFGLNLDIVPGAVELGTTGGTDASVGVHYYF
jgi:hypothetical protein